MIEQASIREQEKYFFWVYFYVEFDARKTDIIPFATSLLFILKTRGQDQVVTKRVIRKHYICIMQN